MMAVWPRTMAGALGRRVADRRRILAGVVTALVLQAGAATPVVAKGASNASALSCDGSIAERFRPNAATKVLLVKAFRKGDALPNPVHGGAYDPSSTAQADLCLVKLLVGPGNPGPADAPSTSAGIGIEIWLPAKDAWNGRVHAIAGGGWVGSEETDLAKISSRTGTSDQSSAHTVAAREGAVTSTTDTGHTASLAGGGAFAMNPDGSINTRLWIDFSSRAIHEQVVMTKALTKAYYGAAPRFTYWDGGSTGGRQALKQAQRYPEDFDGIISAWPAINWSKFITGALYPQVVIQRDLGGRYMTAEQLDLVSGAAVAACDVVDGAHLGFILDPTACRYDPTKDSDVLCAADGGRNGTPACVSPRQALALNKIWYGLTTDGSVPDPAIDNGFGPLTGKHKWYGPTRGTSLHLLASKSPFNIASDMVALELQDPRIAQPPFVNAKANGADGWKSLSYAQLAKAFDAGVALQPRFGDIDTDDPDLSAFKARGGKLIHYHGTNDAAIPYRGSVHYYDRVLATMGGLPGVKGFYRFYIVPGMGHGADYGVSNPALANPPIVRPLQGEVYRMLTDWVEKGIAPEVITLHSVNDAPVAKSLPMCPYPAKVAHRSGSIFSAGSYVCRE